MTAFGAFLPQQGLAAKHEWALSAYDLVVSQDLATTGCIPTVPRPNWQLRRDQSAVKVCAAIEWASTSHSVAQSALNRSR